MALTTGVLMPVLGQLFDQARYSSTFWMVACLPPVGTLLWLLIRTPAEKSEAIVTTRQQAFEEP